MIPNQPPSALGVAPAAAAATAPPSNFAVPAANLMAVQPAQLQAAAVAQAQMNKRSKPEARYVPAGPPEIQPHEFEKQTVLGDGSFGTVFQGRCRSKDVAIKMLHKQDLDAKTLAAFRKEVEILSQIYHPNIVLFMGACTVPGYMCIITELMPKGDVETMLQDKNCPLTLLQRMKMAKDAALGMAWLHGSTPQFIHRDLKTANLLVDASLNIKVCDFGLSQIKPYGENLRDGSEGAKGTPLWMAPEVMMGQPFNEKADIYSFGIVLWELLTRSEPFQEFESFDEFRTAVCYHHKRPPIPDDCNKELRKLIERCWHSNPAVRPPFSEIVERLDDIMLEVAVADDYGRKMWKDCFKRKDSVKWSEFKAAVHELLEWSNRYFKRPTHLPEQNVTQEVIRDATAWQLEEYATRSQTHYNAVAAEFARRQRDGLSVAGEMDGYFNPKNDELNLKCLKAVLAEPPGGALQESDEDIVTMDRFGKLLSWFGPLVDLRHGVILLDKIRLTLAKPWFHGDITTREAEIRLVAKGVGAYLVRFSSSQAGQYTLSKVSRDGSITHQRIQYDARTSQFQMHAKAYPSLQALIQASASEMHLLQPCLGSKYSSLFMDIQSQGYLQSSTQQ